MCVAADPPVTFTSSLFHGITALGKRGCGVSRGLGVSRMPPKMGAIPGGSRPLTVGLNRSWFPSANAQQQPIYLQWVMLLFLLLRCLLLRLLLLLLFLLVLSLLMLLLRLVPASAKPIWLRDDRLPTPLSARQGVEAHHSTCRPVMRRARQRALGRCNRIVASPRQGAFSCRNRLATLGAAFRAAASCCLGCSCLPFWLLWRAARRRGGTGWRAAFRRLPKQVRRLIQLSEKRRHPGLSVNANTVGVGWRQLRRENNRCGRCHALLLLDRCKLGLQPGTPLGCLKCKLLGMALLLMLLLLLLLLMLQHWLFLCSSCLGNTGLFLCNAARVGLRDRRRGRGFHAALHRPMHRLQPGQLRGSPSKVRRTPRLGLAFWPSQVGVRVFVRALAELRVQSTKIDGNRLGSFVAMEGDTRGRTETRGRAADRSTRRGHPSDALPGRHCWLWAIADTSMRRSRTRGVCGRLGRLVRRVDVRRRRWQRHACAASDFISQARVARFWLLPSRACGQLGRGRYCDTKRMAPL
mmetsp:Transcript_76813/g.176230  ORF Transcript_76813/g.176230 Transcript_76813/m.176230 type:complete len:522 (+) Transcript_76813:2439-4004(+)